MNTLGFYTEKILSQKPQLSKKLENVSVADVTELVEEMPEEVATPIVEEPTQEQVTEEVKIAEDFDINAENTFDDLFKDLENVMADEVVPTDIPAMEEMTVEEMPLIMEEMPEEPAAPVVEEPVVEEPVVEEPVVEEPVVEEPVAEEPAPAISLPAMDSDPNKQLSADEIAALFASIQ